MLQALPTPSGMDRWTTALQPRGQGRPAACAIMVAAIHAALLLALIRVTVPVVPAALDMSGVPLIIEQVDPVAAAALNAAAPAPPPLAVPRAVSVTTNPAPALAPIQAPPHAASHPQRTAASHPNNTAQARPAASPSSETHQAGARPAEAAPPHPAEADDPAALAGLEARIDSAVQAASSMPEAARRQHRQGRARLRFTYLDGAVDDISLVVSSDSRVLDDAALAAVRRARYPAAPAIARGKRLSLLVWIDFHLSPEAS